MELVPKSTLQSFQYFMYGCNCTLCPQLGTNSAWHGCDTATDHRLKTEVFVILMRHEGNFNNATMQHFMLCSKWYNFTFLPETTAVTSAKNIYHRACYSVECDSCDKTDLSGTSTLHADQVNQVSCNLSKLWKYPAPQTVWLRPTSWSTNHKATPIYPLHTLFAGV